MFLKTSSVVILKTIILFKSLLLSYENIDVFYKVLVLTFSFNKRKHFKKSSIKVLFSNVVNEKN